MTRLSEWFGILVNWHISMGILTRLASYPRKNACWKISIYYYLNCSLKRLVYVAGFFTGNFMPEKCFEVFFLFIFHWKVLLVANISLGCNYAQILITFHLKGMRSYWQYFFWLWTERKTVWFIIKKKTVTTIIFLSTWKELEKDWSACIIKC